MSMGRGTDTGLGGSHDTRNNEWRTIGMGGWMGFSRLGRRQFGKDSDKQSGQSPSPGLMMVVRHVLNL